MANDEDGDKAITSLNGSSLLDRTITVSEARPQKERSKSGFGGGGGGGRGRSGGGGVAASVVEGKITIGDKVDGKDIEKPSVS